MSNRRVRLRTAVCLSIAGLVLVALAPPGSSAARQEAELTVSPRVYVGGQQLTFEGNLGVSGERRIRLKINMGRPGDKWTVVDGFRSRTNADGSFRFTRPAPSMFNVRMRVVSRGVSTPARTFEAKSQELVIHTESDVPGLEDDQVLLGIPFRVQVDTTPDDLRRRPDLVDLPVFPGRTLTLQQQVGAEWRSLETTLTDEQGDGSFEVLPHEQAEAIARAYPLVYRVRQEDWTEGGSDIGWFPSFPMHVDVVDEPLGDGLPTAESKVSSPSSSTTAARLVSAGTRIDGTASQNHGWRPALWDFGWTYGESLTSPPNRGTDKRGFWVDSTTGAGRAGKHNGGLMLDSQRHYDGPGDFGTTSATLGGNPMKYGRWETKLRLKSSESSHRDYHARIELVPNDPANYHCGAQNITVADIPVAGDSVGMGVKALAGNRQWTRTRQVEVGDSAHAFAVEVSRRHISWFMNGRVMATVRSRAAVSDVPMTLRLSLVGQGEQEMNKAQFISDWQRGYSLDRGKRTISPKRLKRGTHGGGC